MNIFEEEVRKMAEEIARHERANKDSASECSQIAPRRFSRLGGLHWQLSTGREH
jgi:hypothetical protein